METAVTQPQSQNDSMQLNSLNEVFALLSMICYLVHLQTQIGKKTN